MVCLWFLLSHSHDNFCLNMMCCAVVLGLLNCTVNADEALSDSLTN